MNIKVRGFDIMLTRTLIAALSLLFVCGCTATHTQQAAARAGFAIEHVTILPMTAGGAPIADATLIVRDGRIAWIGAAAAARVPANVTRIDGRGRWLMPGLSDMHVHVLHRGYGRQFPGGHDFPADYVRTADLMLPFIANGITQIMDMSASPYTLAQRDEIDSGAVLGPHVAAASMIDGDPPTWPKDARVAATPEAGRRAVREIASQGFSFVKVYTGLQLPVYAAIVDEAARAGVRVVGHLPAAARGHAEEVLIRGMSMVAHAEEYGRLARDPTDADLQRYVALTRQNDISLATTLITNVTIARQTHDPSVVAAAKGIGYVHPALRSYWQHANRYTVDVTPEKTAHRDKAVEFNQRLIKALAASGVRFMPGTDSIIPGIVYGFSLHDELELLAQTGLSNQRVLESATRLPAEFLQVANDRGTIEVGKAADLLLLDADPLADVANTRAITAVVRGGRYLPRSELDGLMQELAARYEKLSAMPNSATNGGGHADVME
jgi:imidazolonepropionase-like amidohydrolase